MKTFLNALLACLLIINLPVAASHELGGEISYERISAYAYKVKYTLFRDCQGAAAPATVAMDLRSPGCNNGSVVTLDLASRKPGKPYGAATPASCTGTSLPMFEIVTYSGQVNFSAAEFKCGNWVLSVSSASRTPAENIVISTGNANFYTEAHLKLLSGAANSSPVFDTLNSPLMYVNYGTDYNLSMAAKDPEGDSLAYKLVAPLTAANMPVAYSYTPFGGLPGLPPGMFINPNPRPPYSNPYNVQVAQMTGGPSSFYSPIFPILSLKIDWNGPPTVPYAGAPFNGMIWAANPYFELDAATGKLKFNAMNYAGNNTPGKNRYLVSILVEEYRKINGVTTKLGSVRRETLIQVFYNNTNLNPATAPVSGNQPAQFRTANLTGTSETELTSATLTAFPNPFTDELTFSLNLTSKAESIIIYNLLGQQVDEISVKTLGLGAQKIKWQNAGKHAAGTYVAKLISRDKKVQTLKFTKLQ